MNGLTTKEYDDKLDDEFAELIEARTESTLLLHRLGLEIEHNRKIRDEVEGCYYWYQTTQDIIFKILINPFADLSNFMYFIGRIPLEEVKVHIESFMQQATLHGLFEVHNNLDEIFKIIDGYVPESHGEIKWSDHIFLE